MKDRIANPLPPWEEGNAEGGGWCPAQGAPPPAAQAPLLKRGGETEFGKCYQENAMAEAQTSGTIVQCIGAVIDIEFPRDAMPGIYDALVLEDSGDKSFAEKGLTFEVEQQLGDGVGRCIALGSSDGLRRGMKRKSTGAPISVPVGKGTLVRILGVLGRPIDDAGPVQTSE